MPEEFLTVSELNNFVRDVLRSGFPQALWVTGEIQELREKNNHLYFTLSEKEKDSAQVVAKIGATIWGNMRPRIDAVLKRAENAFELKEDVEVKLLCKVDFYPPFGQIRLIVEGIDPVFTLGKIAQERQKLIAQLKQKGVLDKNKQLLLSRVPLNIGLITSYESAAYHDFTDELKRSGFAFKVFMKDSVMQGKNAELSVIEAIQTLNTMASLDVIVITRGGGSVTELACFDSAKIAEAVAASRLAVISGIGHEINTTIIDLSAHTFAKTPTAVAQLLISRVSEFLDHLNERQDQVVLLAKEAVLKERRRLKEVAGRVQGGTTGLLKQAHQDLARISQSIKRSPQVLLKDRLRSIGELSEALKKTIHLRLERLSTKINHYQKLVVMSDPKKVLRRGFTITRDDKGRIIKSVKALKDKGQLETEFADGVVVSDIREIK